MSQTVDWGARLNAQPRHDRDHLRLHLQTWAGPRLPREGLVAPTGERDTLTFGYLGDMQLSIVFDPPGAYHVTELRPEDLTRLGLTPGRAIGLAVANVKRLRGEPGITAREGGIYELHCALPDDTAAYLLDRAFWHRQLQRFPHGVLAAVPHSGVFLFAPAGDEAAEAKLMHQAARIYASAGPERISACIYRFDTSGWQPHADLPHMLPVAEPAAEACAGKRKAWGRGKMLVSAVLLGLLLIAMVQKFRLPPAILAGLSLALIGFGVAGLLRLSAKPEDNSSFTPTQI